jgi:hypothetical protein
MAPMRTVKQASVWISALSLLLVLLFCYVDFGNSSPGEITFTHAQESILLGSANCSACHGSQSQTMTVACLACHAEIGVQLASRTSVHGTLADELREDCSKCHSEHHGGEFALVSSRSFSLAGIPDAKNYSHAKLDFHLSGKHQQIACEKCHVLAETKLLPKGSKRFLGLDQRCASCHEDVHEGSYGQDCASCHGQQHPFSDVAEFEHTAAFELFGSHGKAACVECHQNGSDHSIAKLLAVESSRSDLPRERTCRACHLSPHNDVFLVAAAKRLNLDTERSCQHCHDAVHQSFVGSGATMNPVLHTLTGFPLDHPHDAVACSGCHKGFGERKGAASEFAKCYPGRRADDCQVCHGDPHRGQFAGSPWRAADCLSCHEKHRFRPALFGLVQHDRTQFPLIGAHRKVRCDRCHKPRDLQSGEVASRGAKGVGSLFGDSYELDLGTRLRTKKTPDPFSGVEAAPFTLFSGTPTECRACHTDPHQGQFSIGKFTSGNCSTCHNQNTFVPAMFTLEQHNQTRFPLTGAHQAVNCNACHVESINQNQKYAATSMVASRVFQGTPTSCSSCHADAHDGAFNRAALPVTIEGEADCAKCHTTERFDQLRIDSFDHELWTGYRLDAAHARADCAACHKRSRVPDKHGRMFGRVAGSSCQTCHADPHVGQFGSPSRVDCARCHVVSDSFRDLVFDHQAHSAFKLDEVHVKLDCSKCHRSYRLPDGTTTVRYKPLGTQCADCHDPSERGRARRKSR